jgi:hypothetical protein
MYTKKFLKLQKARAAEVLRKAASSPQLPASTEKALANHGAALAALEAVERRTDLDRNAARLNFVRATEACYVEMIKGALSRPIAAPWAR